MSEEYRGRSKFLKKIYKSIKENPEKGIYRWIQKNQNVAIILLMAAGALILAMVFILNMKNIFH